MVSLQRTIILAFVLGSSAHVKSIMDWCEDMVLYLKNIDNFSIDLRILKTVFL